MAHWVGVLYDRQMAKVLVVDDDPDAGESMRVLLAKAGHEAVCVPNGKKALANVLDQLPDVIVLDLVMPEMDGTSFLEVIRSYLRLHALPVVVLTGFPNSPTAERASELKVNAILVKGRASPNEIVRAIEDAASRA